MKEEIKAETNKKINYNSMNYHKYIYICKKDSLKNKSIILRFHWKIIKFEYIISYEIWNSILFYLTDRF